MQGNLPALAVSIRDVEEVWELVWWRGQVVRGRPVAVCLIEIDKVRSSRKQMEPGQFDHCSRLSTGHFLFSPFRWNSDLLGSVEAPLCRHITKLRQLSERRTIVLFSQRRASWKSRLGTMHLKKKLIQRSSWLLWNRRSFFLSLLQAIYLFIFTPSLLQVIFIFIFLSGNLYLYFCTRRS